MTEAVGRVFDIQKFSLHDGPGIRTLVFLKGCPMACAWCSNPGSRELRVLQVRDPVDPASSAPDSRDYSVDEVVATCLQDLPFYQESGGGVTLSGGEAMVQHRFSAALLRRLRDNGVHTAIETTGYAAPAIFARLLGLVDLAIIDVKHHDPGEHRRWTGVGNGLPLQNLATAIRAGGDVLVRIPVIPGVNDTPGDAVAFCRLLAPLGVETVQLLPFHQFGERKYELLDWEYRLAGVPALHEEDLTGYRDTFRHNGIEAFF
ncbi:MAG: glycyl-radical enzyme activating protein [Propionicimonas sp.]|nr:glycyl-radical enzyme activating protein [Propionicimonas sp.]